MTSTPEQAEESELRVDRFSGPAEAWDRSVADLGGGTFCHLHGWDHVLGEAFGLRPVRLVALDASDTVRGLLPLVEVRSRLFGSYLVSMPYLSYGGPVGSETAVTALIDEAVGEARSRNVDLLELRARRSLPGRLTESNRKITVVKELPPTSEELWEKGLRAKLRSQVRRPMKSGMTSSCGLELVDRFYAVFSRTMRDLGTPVLPIRFFEAIAEAFPDEAIFCVVDHEGEPAAAGCGFAWGGEVEITWAGALRELSREAPNMLLYWAFMEESIRRGATLFNFGRCSPDSGTHRFKKQWGSEDQPLPWAQWSAAGLDKTPSPEGRVMRLATNTWRRLPLPVANRLGPLVSPSLP